MRKRILQALIVIAFLGILFVSGNVQVAIKREEIRIAAEQAALEALERERAALAWKSLDEEFPEIHIGCTSTVDDLIAMGEQVEFPSPTVNELIDEGVSQIIGTVYEAGDPPLVGIDAGHLGYTVEKYKNTGAQSILGTIEHEWSLKVARVVRDELLERGYDVYMVRDTDDWEEFPYNNGERTEAANIVGCDILVAIHWDSIEQTQVDGFHTIYKGNGQTPNYRLAKAISDAYGVVLNGAISKFADPVSRDDLWQLNVAMMPAIILECGYSSNASDAKWLENEDNYEIIAEGIADGIDVYFEGERKR